MREPRVCAKVGERLARHGLPADRIHRITGELADHWEDLRAEGMKSGVTPGEARDQADLRLGKPDDLAADLIESLRRSSWLGRHPLLSVCLLPLLLPPVLMGAVVFPIYWITKAVGMVGWNEPGPSDAQIIVSGLNVVYYVTLLLSTAWLCWGSWRAGLGFRWIMATCSWCALTALLRFFDADPLGRRVVMGFGFPWRLNSQTAVVLILHLVMAGWFLVGIRWFGTRANMKKRGLDDLNGLAALN